MQYKSVNAAEFFQLLRKGLIHSVEKLFSDEKKADVVFYHSIAPAHVTNVTKNYVKHNSINSSTHM